MSADIRRQRQIPKSMHTVTAILAVAEHNRRANKTGETPTALVDGALRVFGYLGAADPKGVRDQAVRALTRRAR